MGGSKAGNFGNTWGSRLDAVSDLLTLASLIPGVDTFADLASVPVDLLRGDYLSAGLSAIGVIPVLGEVADSAKIAKLADNAVDAAKISNKATDAVKTSKKSTSFSNFPKNIHVGKQGKHIIGHNNYKTGKSILSISNETAQNLVTKYSGTGQKIGKNRERVNFNRTIGKYVDPKTKKTFSTTIGTIHYSNTGTHIVPEKPINWRK